jgi:hypothetical protein
MTPILFSEGNINPSAGIAMAYSNLFIRKALKKEALEMFPISDKKYEHQNSYEICSRGYAIVTTGHIWQMIRVNEHMNL